MVLKEVVSSPISSVEVTGRGSEYFPSAVS